MTATAKRPMQFVDWKPGMLVRLGDLPVAKVIGPLSPAYTCPTCGMEANGWAVRFPLLDRESLACWVCGRVDLRP